MKTHCTSDQLYFQGPGRRPVAVDFSAGTICSGAGGLLLREVCEARGLLERFAACFKDLRAPGRIEHTIRESLAQRTLAIALA